jgi:hypothetical protein
VIRGDPMGDMRMGDGEVTIATRSVAITTPR